ncbi:MAG: carboxypeptidase regulatory-like domain-containing protein [Firmicutes bacterium]|nr:carboxypeptidase regulatory-like domain-containing protein [Bacillota bacterium]
MSRRNTFLTAVLLLAVAIVAAGCGTRNGQLSGRVVDGAGQGLGGVQVHLGHLTTVTASNGTFTFEDLEPGTYDASITVGDETVSQGKVAIAARAQSIEFVYAKAQVAGTVVDHEGNPLAGAKVTVAGVSGQTAGAGSFVLDQVPYGTHDLSVEVDGTALWSEPVTIDRAQLALAIELPSCLPGPNPPEGMRFVYCEDFTSGDNLRALGWEPVSGWTVIEADGRRWISSPSSGLTSTYVTVPEMGNATKVVVEYKTRFVAGSDIFGVNILANEFPGGDQRRGGTSFFAASTGKGKTVNMRKITNNNYPGITQGFDHHFLPTSFDVPDGSVVTLRITYDHHAKTLDLHYNGQRAPGYPWNLPNDALIRSANNNKLILFARDTTAHWTDIKVWVSHD